MPAPAPLAAATSLAGKEGRAETLAAFVIVLGVTFLAVAVAGWLFRLLGSSFLRLSARLVGIVLFAIAVDFILDGLEAVLVT